MKISFDFDGTLSAFSRTGQFPFKEIAAEFIKNGHEVWITTSRWRDDDDKYNGHADLFSTANHLNIPLERIQFTNYADKAEYLSGFDIHFDNDQYEIDVIYVSPISCVGILVNNRIS